MSKKKGYTILAVVCILLIIIVVFVVSDRKLNVKSDKVALLYKYLGETDIYHCGGLNTYGSNTVTKDDINKENLLCMAYYHIEEKNLQVADSTDTNEYGTKICKVGKSITLAVNDKEETQCSYAIISKKEINDAYKDIYGADINRYSKFFISSDEACFLEGDKYYCGGSETFNYSIAPDTTIYRLIDKAVQKFNGDVIIYDYFLKVSDNACYVSNDSTDVNDDCSRALSKNVDSEFMNKFGTLYKHTFKKASDGYYWEKSELVN